MGRAAGRAASGAGRVRVVQALAMLTLLKTAFGVHHDSIACPHSRTAPSNLPPECLQPARAGTEFSLGPEAG